MMGACVPAPPRTTTHLRDSTHATSARRRVRHVRSRCFNLRSRRSRQAKSRHKPAASGKAAAAPAARVRAAPVAPTDPAPTEANVPYGTHPQQVLDFYKAESDKPTPLVFFIHGGGWRPATRERRRRRKTYLDAGISVVSIEYRFVHEATGRRREAAGEVAAATMRRGRCSSSAARPPSGTSTRRASARPAARRARARACGWPFTTTWPTRRAATRSPANRPGCRAPPSAARRPRSTRSR